MNIQSQIQNQLIQVKDKKGNVYNAQRASARDQQKLLLKLGNAITMGYGVAKSQGLDELDTNWIVHVLLNLDENVFDNVCSLVFTNVYANGNTSKQLTVDDFQDNMLGFFSIIAQLIKGNLQDFFTYLQDEENPE